MVSSVSGTGAGYDSSTVAQARPRAVDQIFQKIDADRDGKITKTELTQYFESDSVETGSSGQTPSVEAVFNALDTGDKGYITKQDVANGMAQAPPKPPGGEGPEAGGAGGGAGGTTSLEDDPRDTNQDGTVSMQEEIAYAIQHYQAKDSTQKAQSVIYG